MTVFDPASIKLFTVIKFPYDFGGNFGGRTKLFVVVGHKEDYLICIKATSQIDVYLNNEDKKAGCVYYEAGESGCFTKDTAIQPDNQFPVSYGLIRTCHNNHTFESLGVLPDSFKEALTTAIANSVTMNDREKGRLTVLLDNTIR